MINLSEASEKELRKYLKTNFGVYVKSVRVGGLHFYISYHYIYNKRRDMALPVMEDNILHESLLEIAIKTKAKKRGYND